ncbi:MAG: peptidylprolyl isomerase [Bacteroidetes bacterium]|nr:peptidylprolyl isomerase [Bacteroidota bacterium]
MKSTLFIFLASAVVAGCAPKKESVVLETSYGKIVIRLFDKAAPITCANFIKLVRKGFYDSLQFHRVIPGFVIQAGDPNTRTGNKATYGEGGPGYTLPAEIGKPNILGSVAMARLPDQINPKKRSSGSQFYICLAPQPQLDGQYTVFGQVIEGMDVAQKIGSVPADQRDIPLTPVYILKAYVEQ